MERSDERLSTRDIASPTSNEDPRFERDDAAADAPGADAAAVPPAPPVDDRAIDDRTAADDRVVGDGDVVSDDRAATTADTGYDETTAAEPATEVAGTGAATTAGTDTAGSAGTSERDDAAPLVTDGEAFQSRWEEIQVRFVDEPRGAVEDADALVATVMQRLAEGFAQERERLEAQWGRGEDISTEDLRIALQRYRSFFQRLLST